MEMIKTILCIIAFASLTGCTHQESAKKLDLNSRGELSAIVYTTTADGTWTGPNWTPGPPPNNLTNVAVVINHTIDYTTTVNINNWNKSDGSVTINPTGTLNINTTNNSLVISNGFQVNNFGALNIDLGTTGQFKIDKAGVLTNTGTMHLIADKVFILDNVYSDTAQTAGAQIINSGSIDMTNTREVHNDGYIENSGNIVSSEMHNDGFICNSGTFEVQGSTTLMNRAIGYIGCGGSFYTCLLEMEGGRIFDQNLCCLVGSTPTQTTVDSIKKQFRNGDYDHATVNTNDCMVFLSSTILYFNAKASGQQIEFAWELADPEIGEQFIIETSTDAFGFETLLDAEVVDAMQTTYTATAALPAVPQYYRLKVLNVDGTELISRIVFVDTQKASETIALFPNPSVAYFNLKGSIPENSAVEIIDMNGRVVFQELIQAAVSTYRVDHELGQGVYMMRLTQNGTLLSSQKLQVQ